LNNPKRKYDVQNTPTKTYPLSILGDLDDTLEDTAQEPSEHDEERCGNCLFSKDCGIPAAKTHKMFYCKRYPPSVYEKCSVDKWKWPVTNAMEWCGEWKPAREM
jgi:hypothetical protein